MQYSTNTTWNTLIVLIAGLFGGQIEIPNLEHTIGQITTPQFADTFSFLIKCCQSAVFAAIGYLIKLAIDHHLKDKFFPKKKP
jgi:hypothetical protein